MGKIELKFGFDVGSSYLLPFSRRPWQLLGSLLRFPLQVVLSLRARLALLASQLAWPPGCLEGQQLGPGRALGLTFCT